MGKKPKPSDPIPASPHRPDFVPAPAMIVRPMVALMLLSALVILAYANTLDNEFVFDDYDLVVKQKVIQSLDNIPRIMGIGEHPMRYRPIRFVSYAIDHHFFGLDPRGYHFSNVLYHLITVGLVYLIVRRLLGNPRVALMAAALFAVHPIQTDAVTYISGRRDVLSTLFYLLGFYLFLLYRDRNQRWYLGLVGMSFILGFYSKEMAITLPAMLLYYDIQRRLPPVTDQPVNLFRSMCSSFWPIVTTYWYLYAPLFVVAGIFFMEKVFVYNPSRMEGLFGGSPLLHFLTVCRIIVVYIKQLIFPVTLNADYSYRAYPLTVSSTDPMAWFAVAMLAAILFGLWNALQTNRMVAFGGVWFFVTLLPVSQIIPHHEPMAEHYLYLPSFGFCLVAALLAERFLTSPTAWRSAIAGFGVIIVLFTTRTVVRNGDWQDDLTLWTKTIQTAPLSARAHENLGTVYMKREQIDQAIVHYKHALAIEFRDEDVHRHLGSAYLQKAMFDDSIFSYREALRIQPRQPEALYQLGRAYGQKGFFDEAKEAFQNVIRYRPHHAKAHRELGTVYFKLDDIENATVYTEKALELHPDDWKTQKNLAIIYRDRGEIQMAIEAYQAVLGLNPKYVEAHLNLAQLHFRTSDGRGEALHHLRRVIALHPDHPQADLVRGMIDSFSSKERDGS